MCVWEGGYYLFHRQCFPIFPDPTETLQWANIKQGFMKPELIWALKVCETCLGTKGRLSAWEQAKGISFSSHRLPCVFLIDRPRPHLIEMTCSWQGAAAFQVDHLSAGKLSSIWFIKKVRWRSLSLRHKHNVRRWVQLTEDYTCVGKSLPFQSGRSDFQRSHLHPESTKTYLKKKKKGTFYWFLSKLYLS